MCSTLIAQAQDKSLFITFNDGSKAEFSMADNPSITMKDGTMTVVAGNSQLDYELWRVKQFTFGGSTDVREIKSKDMSVKGKQVKVFTLDGKAVKITTTQDKVDLSHLAPGVYIININGNSLKYLKP